MPKNKEDETLEAVAFLLRLQKDSEELTYEEENLINEGDER